MRRHVIALVGVLAMAGPVSGGIKAGTTGGRSSIGTGVIKPDKAKQRRRRQEACRKEIDAARAQVAAKKWAKARMILDRAQTLAADKAQARQIGELYLQIDDEGRRQLRQARQEYERGGYLDAIKAFEAIKRTFGALPSGLAAKRAIEQSERDPAARAAVQEVKAGALDELVDRILRIPGSSASRPASRPATQADRPARIKKLTIERQAKAVDLLERIAKLYGASPTGQRATADLKTLRADKAFITALERHRNARKAANALKRAQVYQKAGLTTKAVQYYRQLLRDYPDSEQAAEARAAISLIGPEE